MHQFTDELSAGCFWFDKKMITNKNWAMLTKAAKAVFPVIASHMDYNSGEAFPNELTIAILAGIDVKVARKGIMDLEAFPHVKKIEPYVTPRGRRSKRFIIEKPPQKRGLSFPFHRDIVEGGNWLKLLPTAKALYPVMRCYSSFEIETYLAIEDKNEEYGLNDFDKVYPDRRWEICEAEDSVLWEYARIHRTSLKDALDSLKEHGLIESDDSIDGWKVFLHPPFRYKTEHLNEITMKRYANVEKNYRS